MKKVHKLILLWLCSAAFVAERSPFFDPIKWTIKIKNDTPTAIPIFHTDSAHRIEAASTHTFMMSADLAFRFSAIDYLLKPIQHTLLVDAVGRFLKKQAHNRGATLRNLKDNLSALVQWEDKRIAIPSGQTVYFFKPSDILLIKGEAAYSENHLKNGGKLVASHNLRHFESLLQDIPFFFRCHKSYIVNCQEVKEYVKSEGGMLVLSNGLQASISADKVADFLAKNK